MSEKLSEELQDEQVFIYWITIVDMTL